jgi:DNA modification methylase
MWLLYAFENNINTSQMSDWKMVMFFSKDARDIFLDKESIDLFFANPSYFESNLEEYGGTPTEHINFANSAEEYINNLTPVVKHIEHALTETGSAFVMLPNDKHNVIVNFYNMVAKNTKLILGKMFVWDFSNSENPPQIENAKMGLIAHLYKNDFYVDEDNLEYVIKLPIDTAPLKQYENLGFIDNALPVELYNKMITAFSKPGDTVCDLFAGTGTIVESALKLGRKFVYNDISGEQLEIAKARYESLADNKNKRYYTRDAGTPFLAPESVDLFLTHPPYFYGYQRPPGESEGQLQYGEDQQFYVDKIIEIIKHMEMALKPTGTIVIGFPTKDYLYKIIEKINTETKLKYGPLFFWDYTNTPGISEVSGVENNIFLNLHKGNQQLNPDYKLESYTMTDPWILPKELEAKAHLGHIHNSSSDKVYERIISAYSRPGDVVADLMAGTGLVLALAKKMGRQTVYNDISDSQIKVAKSLIDNEEESSVELKRVEVIELMTKEVQDMNKKTMQSMNIPYEQQEHYMKESKAELDKVNGIILDMLIKNGVVR